jgi:large subunit ribosomal protein L10
MALTRQQKSAVLDDFTEIFSEDQTITFVRFDRLSVPRMEELRTELRDEEVEFRVAKKTLLGVALDGTSITGEAPELPGQIAVAYGEGKTASARGIYNFATDEETEKLEIVGGIFEGEFRDQEAMMEIAKIPSADELRGMFLNLISSPVSGLVIAIDQYAQKQEA